VFDIQIVDFPDQAKMALQADIKYKSNGQQGALKAKRRNKWLCALKAALGDLGIYGPSGNPHAEPGTQRYTEVPCHEIQAETQKSQNKEGKTTDTPAPAGGWQLSSKNAVLLDDDVFGDPDELHMTSPRGQIGQAAAATGAKPIPSYLPPSTGASR